MDIWKNITVFTSADLDQFLGTEVFANSDNSFSIGTAARIPGLPGDYFDLLAANVDAFGFAPQDALQRFLDPGFLANGNPVIYRVATAPNISTNSSAIVRWTGSYALQKLANGNWIVVTNLAENANGYSEVFVQEFNSNLVEISTVDQGLSNLPAPYDLTAHSNNSYTLTYSHTYPYDTFAPRVFDDDIRVSTAATGTPNGSYTTLWDGTPNMITSGNDSISIDGSGSSQVYWLQHSISSENSPNPSLRLHSVKTQALNAQGVAVGPIRTVHNGLLPREDFEAGSLAATGSSTHDFVAWVVDGDTAGSISHVNLMIRERNPILGANALSSFTVSITDLLGLPAVGDGRRVHQVEVLNSGNIALLWAVSNGNSPEDGVHVTILTAAGTLVEDFVTTVFEDAASVSMAELTDGRLALSGGIPTAGQPGSETPDELGYMIIDPRPDIIVGTAGDDFIIGKTGKAETIHGGNGADRLYTMDGGGTLFGDGGIDLLFGGEGVDFLYGGDEGDSIFGRESTDWIYGGNGADNLNGDGGADIFFGGEGADQHKGGEDSDTVSYVSSLNRIVYVNGSTAGSVGDAAGDTFDSIESFYLSNQDDYFDASGMNQFLDVEGAGGNDTLFGSLGGSYIYGGDGSDIIVLSGGVNTVRGDETGGQQFADALVLINSTSGVIINMSSSNTRTSGFTFTFNGQLQGVFGDVDDVLGSFFGDRITGNVFDNHLYGSLGVDVIYGGDGNDILDGGPDIDLLDGQNGIDTADYSEASFGIFAVLNGANNGPVKSGPLLNLNEDDLRNIENVIGTPYKDRLVGDHLGNRLEGGADNDELDGRGGVDTLVGGLGNDLMIVQDAGDVVQEKVGQGTDRVVADVTYVLTMRAEVETLSTRQHSAVVDINLTGNEFGQIIQGNFGKNQLDGRGGADQLFGFGGDDVYIVDNAGDQVYEDLGGGNDRVVADVSYALRMGAEIEVLTTREHKRGTVAINLTGNEFSQTLFGNSQANQLDGRAGADTMSGFAGGDTYIVDNVGDVIVEALGGGADRVVADITYVLNGGAEVETLTTRQHSLTNAINLTGNEFGQTIQGNFGVNTLDGRGGADTLIGFDGADLYIVDNTGDQIIEAMNSGIDRVVADVSYALNAGAEAETLTSRQHSSTAALNLTGNEFGQTIQGTFGVNVLNGKGGIDTLFGFSGADSFVFDTVLGANNVDQLSDFNVVDDTIHLDDAIFQGLAVGTLGSAAFTVGTAATLVGAAQIIYNSTSGAISYDRDGTSNSFAAVQFATVATGLGLTASDFFVI